MFDFDMDVSDFVYQIDLTRCMQNIFRENKLESSFVCLDYYRTLALVWLELNIGCSCLILSFLPELPMALNKTKIGKLPC